MNLSVIVTSGSLSVEKVRENPVLQIAAVLAKPFELPELLDTVRQVLRIAGDSAASQEMFGQRHSNPQTIHQHN